MEQGTRIADKLYQYLVHLFDTSTTYDVHEFLLHSDVYIEIDVASGLSNAHNLHLIVNPEIYKKHQGHLRNFKISIAKKFEEFSHISILNVEVYPNLNKFQILRNNYTPIITPWEEINKGQEHLIDSLRTAKETIDYQNIGNSSRTLLQKVSTIVFNPSKHKADGIAIDLSEGKFKNRLHTYIKAELGGDENKELRDFALSVITTAEKSVDIANKLTHDLNANPLLAESCVISTITAISIVRLIEK